jgi:hypothetical protein
VHSFAPPVSGSGGRSKLPCRWLVPSAPLPQSSAALFFCTARKEHITLMMTGAAVRRSVAAHPDNIQSEQHTANALELIAQMVRMLSSLTSRSKERLESVYATGHERTVLLLCKSALINC